MKNGLLRSLVLCLIVTKIAYAQNFIEGKVIDAESKRPLSGACVVLKGNIMGVSTDEEGKFTLEVPVKLGMVEVSCKGFVSQEVEFRVLRKALPITVELDADMHMLTDMIIGRNLVDMARDRKTPVAVSTVFSAEIAKKLGNREFPEILEKIPSVRVTRAGGGFGDSEMSVRGFSGENIAVMLNGVPMNDMENDKMYWSNWTGISDVTSVLQIQRGLGMSRLAMTSVGGTFNIVTHPSHMKEGGTVLSSVGNDYAVKTFVSYNTGKNEKGFSASALIGRTSGSKYVKGTDFQAYNYYLALGYAPSERHNFQLMMTGSPQWHNQRLSYVSIADALKYGIGGNPDRRYNPDMGMLKGEKYNLYRNVYHKPVMMFNWDWNASDRTIVNATTYASFGRGFATLGYGSAQGRALNVFKNAETGMYNFDEIVSANRASLHGEEVFVRGARINSHDWYGILANVNHRFSSSFKLNAGIDGRYYKGYHYAMVNDFLGAAFYKDDTSRNLASGNYITKANSNFPDYNPFFSKIDDVSNTILYNNTAQVFWSGVFGQLEYTKNDLSAFVQGSVSNKGYKKTDNFLTEETNVSFSKQTDYKTFLGYNLRVGINHNIGNHNIFTNVGYFEKQPNFNAVYRGDAIFPASENVNEKVLGIELGYGFKTQKVNARVNVYRTTWNDRYVRKNNLVSADADNVRYYAEISNLDELHQGIEFELLYKYDKHLKLMGAFSYGNWYYDGNAQATTYKVVDKKPYVLAGNTTNRIPLLLDKVKVGGTAQMTANLGVVLTPLRRLNVSVDWQYVNKLYANFDVYAFSDNNTASQGALRLPSYNLFDFSASYKLPLFKNHAMMFGLNLYNLLDTYYISESQDNIHKAADSETYKGIDTRNRVRFGFGRTWNFSIKYSF